MEQQDENERTKSQDTSEEEWRKRRRRRRRSRRGAEKSRQKTKASKEDALIRRADVILSAVQFAAARDDSHQASHQVQVTLLGWCLLLLPFILLFCA